MADVQLVFFGNSNRLELMDRAIEYRQAGGIRNRRRAAHATRRAEQCPSYVGISVSHNNNYYLFGISTCFRFNPGTDCATSSQTLIPISSLTNPENLDGGNAIIQVVGQGRRKYIDLTLTDNGGTSHTAMAWNVYFRGRRVIGPGNFRGYMNLIMTAS